MGSNSSAIFNNSDAWRIGGDSNGNYANGYISNTRIVTGSPVYTSANFIPSTSPLTAITGTQLLTLQNATIVDNSTNAFTITNTGSVTTATSKALSTEVFKDQSPQVNNWTPNNISGATGSTLDYMTDVPTLTSATAANYCTLNPIYASLPNGTVTNGNLQVNSSVSSDNRIHGSMAVTSGKWYYETAITATSGTPYYYVGWAKAFNLTSSTYNNLFWTSYEWGNNGDRQSVVNGSSSTVSGTTFTTGDILGFAFDADAGTITCYKNGTSLGVYFSGITVDAPFRPDVYFNSCSAFVNFGQQPFVYTPPSGFVALNTYNL
jgi:hypothetical protein